MDMKRFFLYFITIAALALAGCGGGGSSGSALQADLDAALADLAEDERAEGEREGTDTAAG